MAEITLAIDTSTSRAHVAVVRNDRVSGVIESAELTSEGGNSHHEELAVITERAFKQLGVEQGRLDRVVVGAGPGSFTGLRIGYSFARGMALSTRAPMFGVSSLLGAAWEFRFEGRPVVAILDAGRGEVFFGAYQPGVTGLTTVSPPCLVHRSAISSFVSQVIGQTDVVYVGLGNVLEEGHRRPKRTAQGLVEAFLVEKRTDARSIDLEPEYLRAVAAKTIRERVESANGQLVD